MKALVLLSLLLVGCDQPYTNLNAQSDPELYHKYFIECLSTVPDVHQGPNAVPNEVAIIKACDESAYKQSVKVPEVKAK